MITNYKKYIYKTYFYNLLKVSLVFISLSIIMNLFEEIDFLKESENPILLPLILTILNTPSVIFEIFPFIFLISGIFFFIEIIDKNELVIFKLYGLTNTKIIRIISVATFSLGLLIVILFYNFSASLKFLYLDIKNEYTKDDKYLAVVTSNGLWIKDEINNTTNFISAEKIENDNLLNVFISKFDKNFNLQKVIISKKVNIKNKTWILNNPTISSNNKTQKLDKLEFKSNFDHERILSIFENFSSLNILKLEELKKDYGHGYNTDVINGYKQRLYSYPIYLTLMICIASLLMLNIGYNKSKVFHIALGILVSVIIYYINYFFKAIIETQDVPYIISIWGPQLILFMIVVMNLIRINENKLLNTLIGFLILITLLYSKVLSQEFSFEVKYTKHK